MMGRQTHPEQQPMNRHRLFRLDETNHRPPAPAAQVVVAVVMPTNTTKKTHGKRKALDLLEGEEVQGGIVAERERGQIQNLLIPGLVIMRPPPPPPLALRLRDRRMAAAKVQVPHHRIRLIARHRRDKLRHPRTPISHPIVALLESTTTSVDYVISRWTKNSTNSNVNWVYK